MSNFTKRVKRALTYTVATTTIAWSVGLAGAPMAFGAAMPGDRIKLQCVGAAGANDPCRSVYYLGANGKRYVFPDEKTYKTWYPDFNGIMTIPRAEMESYLIGGNVSYRPGAKMLKVQTDPRVYVVAKGGVLWHLASEAVARALYGDMWAKEVNDLPDAFFASAYSLAVEADGVTPRKVNAAADYDKAAQMAGSPSINADRNIGGTVPTPTPGPTPGPTAGTASTVSVALASDTPASGIVVQNAIRVPFTTVNFTASSDGDATIDSMLVERGGGAAQDGAFAGILLWDADTDNRISNTARTLGTDHNATFNDDIVVKAGTTRKVIIAGNMASSLTNYAGEVPTLGIKSIAMKGATTLVGASLPLHGNYQTLNNTVTIGALTVTTGADNPSSSTQKIGTTDFIFTGLRVTAGSAEDVEVTRIVFNQGGTAADSDVTNLDLVVDSSVVATVAMADNKNAAFDLRANPIKLEKGKSKQVNLRGDITSGSSRTIRWDIKKQDDVIAKGKTYGFSPTPTYNNTSEPYHNQGGTITINRGTVQVTPTAGVSNANIAEDTKEVTVGKFDFDVRGESLSFESVGVQLNIDLATAGTGATTSDITAVKLVDATGKVLGGPVDPTFNAFNNGVGGLNVAGRTSYGTATITDNFILRAGVQSVTVKANLSADFSANDTIRAILYPKAMTVKGVDTGETLVAADKTPGAGQQSALYTVKTAALAVSVSSQPTAQNVVGGTQNFTYAKFRLDAADSGEDIKVTQIKSELFTVTAVPSDFANWRVMDGTTDVQTSSSADPTTVTAGGATTTFVFVNPIYITKGTVKELAIVANVTKSATAGSIRVGLPTPHATGSQISATGKDSGQTASVTLSTGDGQTMTLTSAGSLTVTKSSASPEAGLIPQNTAGLTVGTFRMTATNENVKLEKLYLSATTTRQWGGNTGITHGPFNQVNTVYLYDGATMIASASPTSTNNALTAGNTTVLFELTGNPIVVEKDRVKDITVKVDTASVTRFTTSKGTPGQGFIFSVASTSDVLAKGVQSGSELDGLSKAFTGATLNGQSVMVSTPTVTTNDQLGTSGIASGALATASAKEVYKFRVAADSSGDVGLYGVTFLVSTTTATATNFIINDGSRDRANTTTPFLIVNDNNTGNAELFAFEFTYNDGLPPSNTNVIPYPVPAGGSTLFVLKANLTCDTTGSGCSGSSQSGNVQFQLLGDVDFPATYPNSARTLSISPYQNSFIWSDFSVVGPIGTSSSTASTSEQWFNGNRVRTSTGGILVSTTTAVTFSR